MQIQLTEQQAEQLAASRGEPITLVDPQTKEVYHLLPEMQYQELLADEQEQLALARHAKRNATARLLEEP